MHTWCSPGRVKYGSRAPSRSAIRSRAGLFQSVSIFARETPPSRIYIHMCTLYMCTNMYMKRFCPSGFFGPSRCLAPTPGLTTEYPICAVCVSVCIYTHIHPHTLPPALKMEKTQTTPLSYLPSKITHRGPFPCAALVFKNGLLGLANFLGGKMLKKFPNTNF